MLLEAFSDGKTDLQKRRPILWSRNGVSCLWSSCCRPCPCHPALLLSARILWEYSSYAGSHQNATCPRPQSLARLAGETSRDRARGLAGLLPKGYRQPSLSYNDAVEEALAFGWIDSTVKKLDEDRFAQRFSPRRKTSGLSQSNRERARNFISEGRMTPTGLAAIAHVFDPGEPDAAQPEISPDILEPLQANAEAWKNFQKLPESYRRIRIAYIESRRRHGQEQFEQTTWGPTLSTQ